MHRACLADEAGAELTHDAIGLQQRLQKLMRIDRVVVRMHAIAVERHSVLDLARHGADRHVDAKPAQPLREFDIEIGDRHRPQPEIIGAAVTGSDLQPMIGEIEHNIE